MAVTATPSNHFKYALARKMLDLSADTIRAILVRNGFAFNKDNHAVLANLKGYLAAQTISINASFEIEDSGSGFLAAGFVPGNSIQMSGWTSGGNNTAKTVNTVTAGKITVTDTTGLAAEAAGNMIAISGRDELAAGNGYSEYGVEVTGKSVTENDTDDRMEFACANIDFAASGGSVGPTPGAVLYDDTAAEKTILGYLDFDGNRTIADANVLRLQNVQLRIS
jgi:hypothetical protein